MDQGTATHAVDYNAHGDSWSPVNKQMQLKILINQRYPFASLHVQKIHQQIF